jgi:integrase
MQGEGRAPKTIRNVIGTLHSVMEVAVEQQLVERNPVTMKKLPEVRRSKDLRFLTGRELRCVLAAEPGADEEIRACFPAGTKYGGPEAVRTWWPVVRLLILTAAVTGMRLGELRALRWRDLDFGALKVRVRHSYVRGQMGTPKSDGSVRAIPLASWLISELEAHHRTTIWNQESDLVLAHPLTGRPLDQVRLGLHFKAALRRADVRPVRIHDLRHTFATTVAASGEVSVRTLQEWMGHEDLRTTQIYAAYMPGEREQALVDAVFPGGQLVANSAPAPPTRAAQFPVSAT